MPSPPFHWRLHRGFPSPLGMPQTECPLSPLSALGQAAEGNAVTQGLGLEAEETRTPFLSQLTRGERSRTFRHLSRRGQGKEGCLDLGNPCRWSVCCRAGSQRPCSS